VEEPSTNAQSPPIYAESEGLICPQCGYDLRSITSEKCPECGLPIDRSAMSVSRIPWEHRREIGYFRAFWRTTRLVIFHPKKLAEEINRPVTYRSARQFQFISVLIVWTSLCPWLVADNYRIISDAIRPHASIGWWIELIIFALALLSIGLFLFLATGVASYWFHPRSMPVVRQNRAIALSYYAAAPMAWLWLPSALFLLDYVAASGNAVSEQLGLVCLIVASLLLGAILFDVYAVSVNLMRNVTHCESGRTTAMAILLPAMWGVCVFLAAIIPVAVLYVSFVILSFR